MNLRKVLFVLILLFIFIPYSFAEGCTLEKSQPKSIIIILDKLDFKDIETILKGQDYSIGLMNVKTGNFYKTNSEESFFMTIARGKRIKVNNDFFKGIKRQENGKLYVRGYDEILKNTKDKYVDISQEIYFFGEYFKRKGNVIGYIGNDSSSLIGADEEGYIQYGETDIKYKKGWLDEKTKEILKPVDILIISYKINNTVIRKDILGEFIEELNNTHTIIFPREIGGDVNVRWNTSLVPIIYIKPDKVEGIITSKTTRREGVVTNLDIFPNTASVYDYDIDNFIGGRIESIPKEDATKVIKTKLTEFLNLNILKYLLHGVVILLELYVLWKVSENLNMRDNKYAIIMNSIVIGIFLSFVLGILNLQRSIILYTLVILTASFLLSIIFEKRGIRVLDYFPITTSLIMLYGIFVQNNVLYNSHIGYNNIVAGGRFFGLNNEGMGILLATSILSYFYSCKKIKNAVIQKVILLVYFPIIIFSLSSKYGANLGGYLASIGLFLIMLYLWFFEGNLNRKSLIILIGIGISIFCINLFIELNLVEKSHAGSLLIRTKALGYQEFLSVLIEKIRHFLLMVIIPPWSIIFVGQLYFITTLYTKRREIIQSKECLVIFMVSILALFLNDTGIISFTYMNTYLISWVASLHNT